MAELYCLYLYPAFFYIEFFIEEVSSIKILLGRSLLLSACPSLVAFLVYMLKFQKTAVEDEMPEDDEELPLWKALLFLAVGGVALWGGSELLITGAVGLAEQFNVSQRIIGVSIVSVGTSIPELSASGISSSTAVF